MGDGLQFASQGGEDLFETGFHARHRSEERWTGPGLRISVTTAMRDVTEPVLSGTRRLAGEARTRRIDANIHGVVEFEIYTVEHTPGGWKIADQRTLYDPNTIHVWFPDVVIQDLGMLP